MSKAFTTKADETPEFVAFWALWQPNMRQTDGRGDARDTFFKHVRAGVDPADIVDGARWFLRRLQDKQFIPLAASWINKKAYEDMAEMERAYQERIQSRPVEQPSSVVVSLPKTHFMRQYEARAQR